ncbi:Quaternary amine uptake ABC transporter (QAT) family, ATP-binding protein [uncultured delta proteobacterium]|uniref:Quaternary amine uptake ABC transporter (QAT) family, ATP-binding protein n=1 Tax=uncultured delta proteobacterium TaxID=34034 RepID=A0A212JAR5_9DELT|nr:Quaternary amine uptake ABC transporter (QAT) family, ATP-binding protein [uncultured delta proteobacterium]
MSRAAIIFDAVSKRFGTSGPPAVDGVSLSIHEGEFITILGSSGCGKTTLLKMVNRLYEPDSGSVYLFGENTRDVDAIKIRRRIGYVIQQVGLFPHMTVARNIATVPELLQWDRARIRDRVDALLALVGLEPEAFRFRYPSQLSGGQQQRVGLARALAVDPKIMLLDEPFGAIDAITRNNLQDEVLRLHGGLKKTFLLVTHDIAEAFKLGNRVVVMDKGRVCQFDTPARICAHPAEGFVASLVNSARLRERVWEEVAGA